MEKVNWEVYPHMQAQKLFNIWISYTPEKRKNFLNLKDMKNTLS